ncbi:MAG: hypothetical protein U9Q06_02655 [Nanoarchaeota archaeon]|nr:hypothetical protein [Nanoarchaeota archaeon]
MVEGIDWNKVPEDRRQLAESLDRRLQDYETGCYENYGNVAGGFHIIADTVLNCDMPMEEAMEIIRHNYRYLEAIYDELGDFREVPLTRDTACFHVCKDLYPNIQQGVEKLEEQVAAGEDPTGTLKRLWYWGDVIVDVGRTSYRRMIAVQTEIRSIPGCENRLIQRKLPKISE